MDWLNLADWLGGALALLGGVAIGRRMRPRSPGELKPMCTCGHGFGTHEDNGGACLGVIREANAWREPNTIAEREIAMNEPIPTSYANRPCPCKRHDGPWPTMAITA